MALMQTLTDNFNDNVIDVVKWDAWGNAIVSGSIVESGGQLNFTSQTTSNYLGCLSNDAYDLTASYAHIELADAGARDITSFQVFLQLEADANNSVGFFLEGTTLAARKKVATVETSVETATYDPLQHRWLRIREAGGDTFWEVSADGNLWVTFHTEANPITLTTLQLLMMIGTYAAETETTTISYDNLNIAATVADTFNWKGYEWNRRDSATFGHGDPAHNGQWSKFNVRDPDEDDYVSVRITNAGGSPYSAEFYSTQQGFGYGTYTTVVGTRLDTLAKSIVFGGVFTFSPNTAVMFNELDVNETSAWGGGVAQTDPVKLGHTYWVNNNGTRDPITDDIDVPADVVQTHRLIWLPGSLTWDSFVGTGTGGTLILNTSVTENVPIPGDERVHFNIWTFAGNFGTPDDVPFTDIKIRDFTFVPAAVKYANFFGVM
jgi:hypothetical protein